MVVIIIMTIENSKNLLYWSSVDRKDANRYNNKMTVTLLPDIEINITDNLSNVIFLEMSGMVRPESPRLDEQPQGSLRK